MGKYCTNCGEQVVPSAKFCGSCGNLYLHVTEETAASIQGSIPKPTEVTYSSQIQNNKGSYFLKRFGANVIDNLIFLVPIFMIQAGLEDYSNNFFASYPLIMLGYFALFLLVTIVPFAYFVLMESSVNQGTIGKKVMGLKVVNENGARIGFASAVGRYLGKFLSNILLVGYIMIFFTEDNKGFHDSVSGCKVVKR